MTVLVIGGGIIGLSIAWRLRQRGADVVVRDDGRPSAWSVAAGMLGAGGEAAYERPELAALMAESARRWPGFAAELAMASGHDLGHDTAGTLGVALTADDTAEAGRIWRRERLTPVDPRDLEPALSPRIRAGAFAPGDHQVDPRRVVAALRSLVPLGDAPQAEQTVVAAGCGTAALTGLPIRPVKGQVVRLRGEPGLIRHVISGHADGLPVYLVPRADGEVVVGATQEERTDDAVTAGSVRDLLRAATDLVPALADHTLTETSAGFRPGTPDNAPILGRLDDGRVVAAGHFRNGVLLAPVTADLITDLVLTGHADPMLAPFDPGRFA